MRILSSLVASLLTLTPFVSADLRMASTPRNGWKVESRNNRVKFNQTFSLYMEPSDFNFQQLKNQRDNGAYDQFLRSNIDNEHDKRNFKTEAGRDMLPFRSFEGAARDTSATVKNKIPSSTPGPVLTATPGQPYIVPFRWNNPHASELEVNVWIFANSKQYVVPVRKPTCSGEGYQDNVITFTIPSDFNTAVASSVANWQGCKKTGDCVLQIYAHSVETRTYAIGTPLVVNGNVPTAVTADANVKEAKIEVGTNIGLLARETCLPSNSPNADITKTEVREPRFISDQFNHAYQNSDYSPYSGQQPDSISRNLQAASVLRMITGNRGELGKALLWRNRTRADLQKSIEKKFEQLYRRYESIANDIIDAVKDKTPYKSTDVLNGGNQKTAECFRCAEVGATSTNRLRTTTYIPSFTLQASEVDTAKQYIAPKYKNMLSASNTVQIYVATLLDMSEELRKAAQFGLLYQPAVVKNSIATWSDDTQFMKKDATGKTDNGLYAATKAYEKLRVANLRADTTPPAANDSPMTEFLRADVPTWPASYNKLPVGDTKDMDAMNYDEDCETDEKWDQPCVDAKPLFAINADGDLVLAADLPTSAPGSSTPVPNSASTQTLSLSLMFATLAAVLAVIRA